MRLLLSIAIIFFTCLSSVCLYAQESRHELLQRSTTANTERTIEQATPGNVSLDFKDADIRNVLKVLSYKSGVNIVLSPEVTGLITIQLINVPWERALDVILKLHGYGYEKTGNVITVNTLDKIREQRTIQKELAEQEPLTTEVYTLNFAKAEEVVDAVKDMLTVRGNINFDERTNTVMVMDTMSNAEKILSILPILDSVTPQVLIEAKIIETTLDNDDRLGINWTTDVTMSGAERPTTFPFDKTDSSTILHNRSLPGSWPTPADTLFSFGTLDFTSFQAVLNMLSTKTDTNILSNPRIVTLDNQAATITVGTKWPIAQYAYNTQNAQWEVSGFEYMDFGVLLRVTPHVNKAGFITMDIEPEISRQRGSDTITFSGAQIPIITTQETSTRVMIKDRETLVIAGLIKDETIDTIRKIPILGDIPLLGLLFQHKTTSIDKTDLLIFITPHIITSVIPPET